MTTEKTNGLTYDEKMAVEKLRAAVKEHVRQPFSRK